jgi:ABC-2 type transport system permease protein
VRQLLAAEVLKLRTTRTFVALVGSAVFLSLLLVSLQAAIDDNFSEDDVRMMFTGDFTPLFIILLGVMGMAGEWRHRTITSTVLAVPDRLKLLGAKTLGYAVVGALVSVTVTVAIMAIGTAILSGRGETTIGLADLADVLWRNAVVAAYLGALGVCVGALLRNQVAAIVGLLIYMTVAEPLFVSLVSDVGIYSPINGVTGGISDVDWDDVDLLAPGAALALGVGWIATFFGAAALVLKRRDLT